uniref:Alcohol dehydrogenase-like C-terminal domain-containing protein n=1 Tax=Loxodonta africana TaxID=9785 RepID=G3T2A7_LOXAF
PGDKVIPLVLRQCGKCDSCLFPKGNICNEFTEPMANDTSRVTCKGNPIYQLFSLGTFTEYTVLKENNFVRFDRLWISAGYGESINHARVKPNSTCVVFGLGGVGLSIIMGCKAAGAFRIIGVDVIGDKFGKVMSLGATECINPRNLEKPIQQVLIEMTGNKVDYSFEATSCAETILAALESCNRNYGKCVIVGVIPLGTCLYFDPSLIFFGFIQTDTACSYKCWKGKDGVLKIVSDVMAKKINLDPLITHMLHTEQIQEGIDLHRSGKRCVFNILLF